MCVYSMVYDHFGPKFPNWGTKPLQPQSPINPIPWPSEDEIDKVIKLIEDFQKASEAAKVVDELTGQPDCVDLEKKKLDERIAILEKQVAELTKKKSKPKKKKK